MSSRPFHRIYYYHLKKCGGTSLSHWLQQQVADDRLFNPAWLKPLTSAFLDEAKVPKEIEALGISLGQSVFHWTDAVCSHMPLRRWVPEDTLCVTVLRDPVSRLVSQVADWRRLSEGDYATVARDIGTMIRDTALMPLKPFLEKHGRGALLFDNYLVRALAAARLGFVAKRVEVAEHLLDDALESLVHDFHIVGITERLEITLNVVADLLGRVPETQPPRLNETRSASRLAEEVSEAAEILADLTRLDRPFYDRALRLFADRHAARGAAYNRTEFDSTAAAQAVAGLVGRKCGEATVYSVRDPVLGSGFHGRDASGTPACRVWSGPSARSILYMPVPVGVSVALQLWIHGYAADDQRDRLRCFVDGLPAEHSFVPQDGYRDLVEIKCRPARGFVALEVDVGATVPAGKEGTPEHDSRLRGLSFDRYGWRVLAEATARGSYQRPPSVTHGFPEGV